MKRPLVLGVGVGSLVSVAISQLFTSTLYIVLVIGIIYAATAYFYVAADIDLLGSEFSFANSTHALGYGIGLFGLSVSPVAFGQYYTDADIDPVFLIWFLGVIAFFQFASRADREGTPTRRS